MIQWIPLEEREFIAHLAAKSFSHPCLIFKHSTRCMLSTIAKMRLEEDWPLNSTPVQPYLLDIIAYPHISSAVSDYFSEFHESPQLLLIQNGECTYEASHQEISVEDLLLEFDEAKN